MAFAAHCTMQKNIPDVEVSEKGVKNSLVRRVCRIYRWWKKSIKLFEILLSACFYQ